MALDIHVGLGKMGYEAPPIASSGAEVICLSRDLKSDLVFMEIFLVEDMDGIAAAIHYGLIVNG
jgi:hypothetical protein